MLFSIINQHIHFIHLLTHSFNYSMNTYSFILHRDKKHKITIPHPPPDLASVISLLSNLLEGYFAFNFCIEIQISPKQNNVCSFYLSMCERRSLCGFAHMWSWACQDIIQLTLDLSEAHALGVNDTETEEQPLPTGTLWSASEPDRDQHIGF